MAPPTLDALPLDILFRIAVDMKSRDIFQLGLTCKELGRLTEHRTVWASAAEGMLMDYGVSLRTFPLKRMDCAQLKRLATSPLSFLSKLRSAAVIHPSAVQFLVNPLTQRIRDAHGIDTLKDYQFVQLVLGGRFLVTVRGVHIRSLSGTRGFVQLWDLGCIGASQHPTPVAEYILEGKVSSLSYPRYVVSPSMAPDCFNLFVSHMKPGLEVQIVSIDPFSQPPRMVAGPKLTIQDGIIDGTRLQWPCIWKTRVALLVDDFLVIWDFVKDEVVRWKTRGLCNDSWLARTHLYEDILFIAPSHLTKIVSFDIPPAQDDDTNYPTRLPRAIYSDLFLCDFLPDYIEEEEDGVTDYSFTFSLSTDPWNQSLDTQFWTIQRGHDLAIYKVEHWLSASGDIGPGSNRMQPVHIRTAPHILSSDPPNSYLSSSFYWEDNIGFAISRDCGRAEEIFFYTAPTDTSKDVKETMLDWAMAMDTEDGRVISVCHVTGRVCTTVGEHIVILDTLVI